MLGTSEKDEENVQCCKAQNTNAAALLLPPLVLEEFIASIYGPEVVSVRLWRGEVDDCYFKDGKGGYTRGKERAKSTNGGPSINGGI